MQIVGQIDIHNRDKTQNANILYVQAFITNQDDSILFSSSRNLVSIFQKEKSYKFDFSCYYQPDALEDNVKVQIMYEIACSLEESKRTISSNNFSVTINDQNEKLQNNEDNYIMIRWQFKYQQENKIQTQKLSINLDVPVGKLSKLYVFEEIDVVFETVGYEVRRKHYSAKEIFNNSFIAKIVIDLPFSDAYSVYVYGITQRMRHRLFITQFGINLNQCFCQTLNNVNLSHYFIEVMNFIVAEAYTDYQKQTLDIIKKFVFTVYALYPLQEDHFEEWFIGKAKINQHDELQVLRYMQPLLSGSGIEMKLKNIVVEYFSNNYFFEIVEASDLQDRNINFSVFGLSSPFAKIQQYTNNIIHNIGFMNEQNDYKTFVYTNFKYGVTGMDFCIYEQFHDFAGKILLLKKNERAALIVDEKDVMSLHQVRLEVSEQNQKMQYIIADVSYQKVEQKAMVFKHQQKVEDFFIKHLPITNYQQYKTIWEAFGKLVVFEDIFKTLFINSPSWNNGALFGEQIKLYNHTPTFQPFLLQFAFLVDEKFQIVQSQQEERERMKYEYENRPCVVVESEEEFQQLVGSLLRMNVQLDKSKIIQDCRKLDENVIQHNQQQTIFSTIQQLRDNQFVNKIWPQCIPQQKMIIEKVIDFYLEKSRLSFSVQYLFNIIIKLNTASLLLEKRKMDYPNGVLKLFIEQLCNKEMILSNDGEHQYSCLVFQQIADSIDAKVLQQFVKQTDSPLLFSNRMQTYFFDYKQQLSEFLNQREFAVHTLSTDISELLQISMELCNIAYEQQQLAQSRILVYPDNFNYCKQVLQSLQFYPKFEANYLTDSPIQLENLFTKNFKKDTVQQISVAMYDPKYQIEFFSTKCDPKQFSTSYQEGIRDEKLKKLFSQRLESSNLNEAYCILILHINMFYAFKLYLMRRKYNILRSTETKLVISKVCGVEIGTKDVFCDVVNAIYNKFDKSAIIRFFTNLLSNSMPEHVFQCYDNILYILKTNAYNYENYQHEIANIEQVLQSDIDVSVLITIFVTGVDILCTFEYEVSNGLVISINNQQQQFVYDCLKFAEIIKIYPVKQPNFEVEQGALMKELVNSIFIDMTDQQRNTFLQQPAPPLSNLTLLHEKIKEITNIKLIFPFLTSLLNFQRIKLSEQDEFINEYLLSLYQIFYKRVDIKPCDITYKAGVVLSCLTQIQLAEFLQQIKKHVTNPNQNMIEQQQQKDKQSYLEQLQIFAKQLQAQQQKYDTPAQKLLFQEIIKSVNLYNTVFASSIQVDQTSNYLQLMQLTLNNTQVHRRVRLSTLIEQRLLLQDQNYCLKMISVELVVPDIQAFEYSEKLKFLCAEYCFGDILIHLVEGSKKQQELFSKSKIHYPIEMWQNLLKFVTSHNIIDNSEQLEITSIFQLEKLISNTKQEKKVVDFTTDNQELEPVFPKQFTSLGRNFATQLLVKSKQGILPFFDHLQVFVLLSYSAMVYDQQLHAPIYVAFPADQLQIIVAHLIKAKVARIRITTQSSAKEICDLLLADEDSVQNLREVFQSYLELQFNCPFFKAFDVLPADYQNYMDTQMGLSKYQLFRPKYQKLMCDGMSDSQISVQHLVQFIFITIVELTQFIPSKKVLSHINAGKDKRFMSTLSTQGRQYYGLLKGRRFLTKIKNDEGYEANKHLLDLK